MRCEICGADPRLLISLPIVQADGKLNTMACEECARKSGRYCLKHQTPFLGFNDGTAVCPDCVDETATLKAEELGQLLVSKIGDKKDFLPWSKMLEIHRLIAEYLEVSSEFSIGLSVITESFRQGKTGEALINEVVRTGDPNCLLEFAAEDRRTIH